MCSFVACVMCSLFACVMCSVLPVICVVFSLCYVQFLACVMCSSRATARPVAAGGRFAPAGLASRAQSITVDFDNFGATKNR